jgi:hypothetical protein
VKTNSNSHQIKRFRFDELEDAPLIVDAIYEGGVKGNIGDDPITKLIPSCENQGGFRMVGGRSLEKCTALVITSSGSDPDWPDRLDPETGIFTYYGDNKKPGCALHETAKGGNRMLDYLFQAADSFEGRKLIPPILVFIKTEEGRNVSFKGIAVPDMTNDGGLIAIWRQTLGYRFQNYRANFMILDCREVSKQWLKALVKKEKCNNDPNHPKSWSKWIKTGIGKALLAPKTIQHRSKEQQLPPPTDKLSLSMLEAILDTVKDDPFDFEFIAAEIFKMVEPRAFDIEITRKTADGGRDAFGKIRLGGDGGESDGIFVEFALEAKAFSANNGVGVKETSRLISRLRHRQVGVLITTSYLATQAYKELRADNHPVIIISGGDICQILKRRGLSSRLLILDWVSGILRAEPKRGT